MRIFKADLHLHSVLSPCASLDMSPKNIVNTALKNGIDIIAITDHNSTLQSKSVLEAAKNTNLSVFLGVEINSKEEVHALAYFENLDRLQTFQDYINLHLPFVQNDVEKFGYQVVVDINETILFEEEKLLIIAMDQTIEQIEKKVHELDGIFIPAHIDKSKNSIISQLGFIPPDLDIDGYELSPNFMKQTNLILPKDKTCVFNSDAHILEVIGTNFHKIYIEKPTFQEYKMALHNVQNRKIIS